MKKIFTVFVFMVCSLMSGQTVFIEGGVNPTTVTTEDVNWVAKAGIDITSNAGVALFYERYNTEGYVSYGVQPSIGWGLDKGFQFSVGTELSRIERFEQFNEGITTTYLTYGFNTELGYEIVNNLIVYFGGDLKYRPDTPDDEWPISPGTGLRFYIF